MIKKKEKKDTKDGDNNNGNDNNNNVIQCYTRLIEILKLIKNANF